MARQVVVYMSPWCGNSSDTQHALTRVGRARNLRQYQGGSRGRGPVRGWVGFESVPTVIIAEDGSVEPFEPPAALAAGKSPRGIDRGSLITEATRVQLRSWLVKHGFLSGS